MAALASAGGLFAGRALLVAMALPFTPIGAWFGFVAPPLPVMLALAAVTIAYLVMAEVLKMFLFDHRHRKSRRRHDHRDRPHRRRRG